MTLQPPRSTDQAQRGLLALLPDGWAATRDPDDYEAALFRPLAAEFATIEASAFSMLPQIDPRHAPNLLPDWERMLGPDPCMASNPITDTATRGNLAYAKLTNAGTICAGYFERLALSVGETITITEFPASICGMSRCGDALNPPPGQCNILVTLPTTVVAKAICGVSTCGDSLGTFDHSVIECVIREGVPLFVTPYFSYTG
jgi:uncharacterized protein YmfQ (DUF2313 family)